jgi:chitodextrinase
VSRRPSRRALAVVIALVLVAVEATVASAATATPRRSFHGRYVLAHSDDFARGRATFAPSLELDDGTVLGLDFRGRPAPLVRPGTPLQVEGSRVGGQIMVADGGTAVETSSSEPVPAGVSKRVAVVLLNFSNDTSQPYSKAHAEGVAFTNANSVAAYYQEASWGNLTLSGDVFGWYTIADDNGGCDFGNWGTQASAAATAAGVNLNAYDYVAYAFPSTSCGWAGLAYLPGRYSYLNGSGAMGLRVFAHELGHNLGTHHASTLSCVVDGVRLSLTADLSGCTANEYGDPFTVMGSASRYQQTNFSRGNAGWLTAANAQTVTATGDYQLAPIGPSLPTQVQSLRVQRGTNSYLTLEFRRPSGTQFDTFAADAPVVNGVSIRIAPGYTTRSQSKLVDATPSTTTFSDAPLAVGQTLTDPAIDVSITTLSVGDAGATVRISFGEDPPPPGDTTPPSVPGGFAATPLSDTRIGLSWTASTDDTAVTGYRVTRDGAQVAVTTGTSFTDTGLAASTTYGYAVTALDAAGNASGPALASATTLAPPDTKGPKRPRKPKAERDGRQVALRWQATTDDVGVTGYVVYRDGKQIATVSGRRFTDRLPQQGMRPAYRIMAFDAAGNHSRRSRATWLT